MKEGTAFDVSETVSREGTGAELSVEASREPVLHEQQPEHSRRHLDALSEEVVREEASGLDLGGVGRGSNSLTPRSRGQAKDASSEQHPPRASTFVIRRAEITEHK